MEMCEKELHADVCLGKLKVTIHYVVRYMQIPGSALNAGELEIRDVWYTDNPDEHLDEEEMDHMFHTYQENLVPLLLKAAIGDDNEQRPTLH